MARLIVTGNIVGLITGVVLGLMIIGVVLGPMITGDIDGISIECVHTTSLESSHYIHWYDGFHPYFGEKVELCDNFSVGLKKLMVHIAPVPFRWPKHTTVKGLGFMCCMWWQARYDYSMISGKAHNLRLVVSDVSIEQQKEWACRNYIGNEMFF